MSQINKLMVANRGEIAIRILRAAAELKITTVSMYTYEDRYSPHRFKADEAYQIGADDDPLKPYLNIDGIIKVALRHKVDAIHPGYGFLSENVEFATKCREAGIIFVGPTPEAMSGLGDKIIAKEMAVLAGVPIIENSIESLTSYEIAKVEADRIGYPIMIKAASGGGGRGMRVLYKDEDLKTAYYEASSEAEKSFDRYNRRHIAKGDVLPANKSIHNIKEVICYIDTSGSVTAPELEYIYNEMLQLKSTLGCRVELATFNTTILKRYT